MKKLYLPALLLIAAALRLWHINAALWYDEAFSAWLAQLPLRSLILATAGDVHPPGYYLLLWAANGLLGHAETVLRLPSLLAGLGLIVVVYRLGHALGISPWPGTIITAIAPFQIYYSQEARCYAILSLCVALVALGLLERRPWLAIGATIIAMWLHNLAAVFVGAVWLASFIIHRSPFIIHYLIALAGSLPALAWTAYQALNNVGQGYWIPPLNNPGRIIATYDDLVFFSPDSPFVFASGIITSLVLVLLLFDLQFTFGDARTRFLLMTAVLPMVIISLASIVWQSVLISRVVAPVAPFYYLLIIHTVLSPPGRQRFMTILAGSILIMVLLVGPLVGNVGRQRRNMEMLDMYGDYRPGDGLYHANAGSYVVWAYYRPDMPQYLWPQATTIEKGLSGPTRQAMGMSEAPFEAVQCRAKRWWLIYAHNPTTTQAEMDYIDHLITDFPSKKIAMLRQDITVEAWLVLLEPNCS